MIKTTIKNEPLLTHKTECLVLFSVEEKSPSGKLAELDTKLKGIIKSSFKNKRFEGKLNQTLLLNVAKPMRADHLLLVGLGKGIEITADKLRQAAGTAAKYAENSKFKLSLFTSQPTTLPRMCTRDWINPTIVFPKQWWRVACFPCIALMNTNNLQKKNLTESIRSLCWPMQNPKSLPFGLPSQEVGS